MKMMKNQLKTIIQAALYSEYGFAPLMKEIVILDAAKDGSYIKRSINEHIYIFKSSYSQGVGVWTGKGTIKKL